MIPILDYRQFIAELSAAASEASGVEVDKVRLAVTESQLITLLKDLDGIIVCGNVPGADITHQNASWRGDGTCLLMVLQKMPRDEQGMGEETDRYARLQRLMAAIIQLLTAEDEMQQLCDRGLLDPAQPLRVEWEYNAYGGFNGLSVSFHLLSGLMACTPTNA